MAKVPLLGGDVPELGSSTSVAFRISRRASIVKRDSKKRPLPQPLRRIDLQRAAAFSTVVLSGRWPKTLSRPSRRTRLRRRTSARRAQEPALATREVQMASRVSSCGASGTSLRFGDTEGAPFASAVQADALRRSEYRPGVRFVFATYAVVIAAGLVLYTVIGLTQH